MYKFINMISVLIRQFVLPNPYINIIGNDTYADLFNIIIGGAILHFCAYKLTGCGYTRGIDNPVSGSFGYLISYCYVTVLITTLGFFISNMTVFIIVFIILYIVSCILVGHIFNRNSSF